MKALAMWAWVSVKTNMQADSFWLFKWYMIGVLTLSLALPYFDGSWRNNWDIARNLRWPMFVQALGMIAVVIVVFAALFELHPVFQWSWLSLFGNDKGTNLNMAPMRIPYFGLVFGVMLITNLPTMAHQEELWFRLGVHDWRTGLFWSVCFGLVHCVVGVPIAAGLALGAVGIWLTHHAMGSGVDNSTLYHLAYNLTLAVPLWSYLVIKTVWP